MSIAIREVGSESLQFYARVPIRFRVESVFRVELIADGLGGMTLTEEPVAEPYTKDYDSYEEEPLTRWTEHFDVSNWLFLLASAGDEVVAGATVAFRSPNVDMLERRTDLAVLWDLRVCPEYRHRGIGTALLDRAATWARERGCSQLKIETQNVNVAACRFYAAQGCRLGMIHRHAYAGDARVAHEAMLLWYLDL